MKSLSLARPHVLVVVGNPGAGKSYFSRRFAELFGAPLVQYDRIRSDLFNNPNYTNDEQIIIRRVLHYMAGEMFKTGRTFIIDGGFNTKNERILLRAAAKKAGYETLAIWVQTDLRTCRSRTISKLTRKQDPYAPPIPIPEAVFDALTKKLTPPSKIEDYVVISGKHTYASQARTLLRKLTAARASAMPTHQQPKIEIQQRHIVGGRQDIHLKPNNRVSS